MKKIRILLADDHRLFRHGIQLICQETEDLVVIGEAENGKQAVELADQLKPDIVLMDIQMPLLNGVQATIQILKNNPSVRVIILTMYQQDDVVFDAIKAGARGYVLKDSAWEDLLEAIHVVHRGEALVTPSMAVRVLDAFRQMSQETHTDSTELTSAEMEILTQVAKGKENSEIAEILFLSERTVSNRLTDIYRKLRVSNRTQAALTALRKGWVDLNEAL